MEPWYHERIPDLRVVRPGVATRDEGYWLAPCNIVPPSKEDEAEDKRRGTKEAALAKAKKAGLSDDEIAALSR